MGRPILSINPSRGEKKTLTISAPVTKQQVDKHVNSCYVLIGPSGSGKSTWCDALLRNWKSHVRPMVICEDDLIREECDRTQETFDQVSARVDHAEHKRIMTARFHQALGVRRDIIIDRHNLSELDRSELLDLLPDSYQKIAIVFTLPRNMLLERLRLRYEEIGRSYSPMVVSNMKQRYERPGEFEFDRVTTIDQFCQYA